MTHDEARLRAALAFPGEGSSDFDLNPGILPQGIAWRQAAVLVPVWLRPEGARVILTKRASHLQHHPGQVAFPGGKLDPADRDLDACALREAHEEIGLCPGRVELLGRLPAHQTVTGFTVTPVLGLVRDDFIPVSQAEEVEEVFTVPLPHVLDPDRYVIEGRIWRGTLRRYYAVPFGPYYIWGATARMLRGLADRVARCG